MHKHKLISLSIVTSMLLAPATAIADENPFASGEPFTQKLVITAYYSPKEAQCCYVTGSYESDITLNGNGTHGADGTPVYPGMVAAPKSYPFGTRIKLPGLGVFTVHDRGGAIIEGKDAHRLDIWVGEGEEGLARALAFGVQEITATVYPPLSDAPAETAALDAFPAPLDRIKPFAVAAGPLVAVKASMGERSASVQALQEKLRELGYLSEKATGNFGNATKAALTAFLDSVGVSSEPADTVTEKTSALLEAAIRRKETVDPIGKRITARSSVSDIAELQRTLRFLDLYRGRTNGVFTETLRQSLLTLQKEYGLITDEHSPGAGAVGPNTRVVIIDMWKRKHVQKLALRLLDQQRAEKLLAESNMIPSRLLSKGSSGTAVAALQRFLASHGYFPADRVNGNFGELTQAAVLAYQQAEEIVKNGTEQGAGTVGPLTLQRMRQQARQTVLTLVRGNGWAAAEKVL